MMLYTHRTVGKQVLKLLHTRTWEIVFVFKLFRSGLLLGLPTGMEFLTLPK
jgi:hypothetical protein